MTIHVGDIAPELDLPSPAGPVRLADHRGSWVVLYFYPADNSPGCTAEACSFHDAYEDFTEAGAVVIGVSSDSIDSHESFAAKNRLPFTLVTDADGEARAAYGVRKSLGIIEGRVTFVIDPEGVVRDTFSSQIRATAHTSRALEVIRSAAAT